MTGESDLLDVEELAALLRDHEGQPEPLVRRRSRRRLALRWPVAVAAGALLLGSGLGFGLGSSVTPSGDAAQATPGLGFVPEPGWFVVRSRFEASPARPSFAIASNVPLAPLDAKLAQRLDWSGYPLRALQTLRTRGIVMLASFELRGVHEASDESFPPRKLPLRLRDAATDAGPSVRGARLGRYELRAAVGDHNVIIGVYFGSPRPSRAAIVTAQRQLDRLVVGSGQSGGRVAERALPVRPSAPPAAVASSASRVVDRTFACSPVAYGGVGDLDVNLSPLREDVVGRRFVATLELRTAAARGDSALLVARARAQPDHPGLAIEYAVRGAAGVFAHSRRCARARARLPLSSRGLTGPPIVWQKTLDCPTRGRVLVRVRSLLQSEADWRRVDRFYAGVRQPLVQTRVAVRLQRTGTPIAYMEHDAFGRTKLWYSSTCN